MGGFWSGGVLASILWGHKEATIRVVVRSRQQEWRGHKHLPAGNMRLGWEE
jgi:hypothetical protein